jgi:hypothetical protein
MNGRRRGRVAGYHQRLDGVALDQKVGNGMRTLQHMGVIALAIGRVAIVGQVHQRLQRHFRLQGAQHAQAPDATVKDANRSVADCGHSVLDQREVTGIFLNSPVAIFFCHSAGPVMWALVPPASTATVTGMSTTSNS